MMWKRAIQFAFVVASSAASGAVTPQQTEFFEKNVRPVLVEKCFKCHGAEKQKGGLRLDSRAALLKGGEDGAVVVAGDPEKSKLIHAIRWDGDKKMPAKADKLPAKDIEALTQWVKMGLPWPESRTLKPEARTVKPHWAYQPVAIPPVPKIRDRKFESTNPIDAFVLAKLEQKKLSPSPPADRRTLIRRATFDLIGLPPTPEEVVAFVNDKSPDAYEKLIDRLLASPRYGERWGRHWLDVARYADTAGDSSDFPIPQAYRYRNYVIAAFNADKPYDQFIREQIAGDLLAKTAPRENYAELITATGYLTIARRFGGDKNQPVHLIVEDTLDTLGKSVLATTVGCARCHDHKFDPISTKDYYGLYGFFSSSRYPHPGSEGGNRQRDFVPMMPQPEIDALQKPFQEQLAKFDARIAPLDKERAELEKQIKEQPTPVSTNAPPTATQKRLDEVKAALAEARKERDSFAGKPPPIETAYAVVDATGANAKLQKRGDPESLGDEVPRKFLDVLGGQQLPADTKESGRLQLAQWLTDPKNPLTARVIVNRLWQYHFGRGLVATPNDFGTRGQPPSHPELLDHLATRFVASGWSVKAMHKLIMLSHTYQQASADNPKFAAIDPNNEWLWKFSRQRLDAEEIRDAMLFVSGELDLTPGGAHPFPAESSWGFTQHNQFFALYDSNKRSVYVMQQRLRRHPFFQLFDGADPNASTAVRFVSTTPLQALFFMNDPFVHKESEKFAARVMGATSDEAGRVEFAFRVGYGRAPSPAETAKVSDYLAKFGEPKQAAWASYARAMFASNEFLFVE